MGGRGAEYEIPAPVFVRFKNAIGMNAVDGWTLEDVGNAMSWVSFQGSKLFKTYREKYGEEVSDEEITAKQKFKDVLAEKWKKKVEKDSVHLEKNWLIKNRQS